MKDLWTDEYLVHVAITECNAVIQMDPHFTGTCAQSDCMKIAARTNTNSDKEGKIMRKLLVVFLVLMLSAGVCSIASAQLVTNLTTTGSLQVLQLTCNVSQTGNLFSYNYLLNNPAGNKDAISGFTLQFPNVPTTDFNVTSVPTGWVSGVVPAQNKIEWKWVNFANATEELDPGETFQFAFTTAFASSGAATALASAQDGMGYSGFTCGPVPEPASVMMSLLGLTGIVGLRRQRRK